MTTPTSHVRSTFAAGLLALATLPQLGGSFCARAARRQWPCATLVLQFIVMIAILTSLHHTS